MAMEVRFCHGGFVPRSVLTFAAIFGRGIHPAPRPSRSTESSGIGAGPGDSMRQLLLDFTRAPAPTFANFVHGANAELAHALEAAVRGGLEAHVIYVWGEKGAGKTHALQAFVDAGGRRARYVRGQFDTASPFMAIDDVQ